MIKKLISFIKSLFGINDQEIESISITDPVKDNQSLDRFAPPSSNDKSNKKEEEKVREHKKKINNKESIDV